MECITRLVGPQIGSGHLRRGALLGYSVSHVLHPRAHPFRSIKVGALAFPVIPLTISDWGQTLYVGPLPIHYLVNTVILLSNVLLKMIRNVLQLCMLCWDYSFRHSSHLSSLSTAIKWCILYWFLLANVVAFHDYIVVTREERNRELSLVCLLVCTGEM